MSQYFVLGTGSTFTEMKSIRRLLGLHVAI